MDGSVVMDQSGWVFTAKQGSRSVDDQYIYQQHFCFIGMHIIECSPPPQCLGGCLSMVVRTHDNLPNAQFGTISGKGGGGEVFRSLASTK